MPPRKRAEKPTPADEMPPVRACATDEVHERLLRSVSGYAAARSEIEDRTTRILAFGPAALRTGCTEIPVVVHVVHRTSAENISQAQIDSQIEVLNDDFRATNADKTSVPAVFQPLIGDARITFKLATTDPDGNPTDGVTRTSTSNTQFTSNTDDVKSSATGGADPWPADQYLNIWTCGNLRSASGSSLLGYAQFPGGPAATDGIVCLHSAFGTTGSASAPFDKGRTTTHEIGHWLNLRHIWGDDGTGCSGSDFVADTPNAAGPNFGTPTFPHVTCSNGPDGDMFMNYMDYVDDAAMMMFTEGQVDRMQAALDGPRSSIGTTGPCGGKPIKEAVKDLPKDGPKDIIKEPVKELPKDPPKEPVKELPKDPPKEPVKERPKDGPKDFVKDRPKDLIKDGPKDGIKEPVKEGPKERPKDSPKDFVKDRPKDLIKDGPKDGVKEPIKEGPKERVLDPGKSIIGDVPIPGPGPIPGPITPGYEGYGYGYEGYDQAGATPFVLGGGGEAAVEDPLLPVVQQVGALLAAYSAAAAEGTLDAQQTVRWQQLASVYAQLVAMLG